MFAWINVVLDIRCVQMCVSWTNPAGQNCKYMHTVVVRQLQKYYQAVGLDGTM